MKNIINEELIQEAIEFALPTVRALVAKHTWGPKGVVIAIIWPGKENPFVYSMEELGPRESWENVWGKGMDFRIIALQKLSTSQRGGSPSAEVVLNHPWLLQKGDSFYTGAVAEDDGLIVATSGAFGDTDETISWIVWNIILLLCRRKIAVLKEQKINSL